MEKTECSNYENITKDSIIQKKYEFLPISSINQFNCLEFSSNKIIHLLVKIIIFKRGTLREKYFSFIEDPRFSNYDQDTLYHIFTNIAKILETRKLKKKLNPDEEKFIYHIALNLINENGKLNKNEVYKLIKAKLFLDTEKFDSKIFEILNSVKERTINPAFFSIPQFLLPNKSGMYLNERKNNFILATGYKYLNLNSHILFFHKRKVLGIGFIHSIYKEGVINNIYRILPMVIISNDNAVHTEGLEECEYPVKNVPFCVITYIESENILDFLQNTKEYLSIGARLVGDQLLKKDKNSILWYNVSYETLLDMFEKRLIIYGSPSSGKSILSVQILRYLVQKGRKVISIAPSNPNLSKFGLPLKSIGDSNPKWDLDNFSQKYLEKYDSSELVNFSQIRIGENYYMPDIEKLSKKTIISLINEVTGSVQIKNIIALEMVDRPILDILQLSKNEKLLDPEDFQQNQIKTLRRLANILLKWQSIGKKIDLKSEIFSNNDSIGFYIDSELFLPELVYITLTEIFFNSRPCFDIKNEGLFLMVDEIPLLMSSEGVLINGQNLGRIFNQINKQGRNMGILLGSIIQDYTRKIQSQFLPMSLEDYSTFHLIVKNKKRLIKINNEYIIIPPITNI